ncbi:hypothetical protein GF327_05840 [Candidatus Woesearchaeota archaeon]|nr:hypothetical protein [Candidatus Woesearchaeota archaeon]
MSIDQLFIKSHVTFPTWYGHVISLDGKYQDVTPENWPFSDNAPKSYYAALEGVNFPNDDELFYFDSPDITQYFLDNYPGFSRFSLYPKKDGKVNKYKTRLASAFGLPVFAGYNAKEAILTELQATPLTHEGMVKPLELIDEDFTGSGLYVEITKNNGHLIYQFPWTNIFDWIEKLQKKFDVEFYAPKPDINDLKIASEILWQEDKLAHRLTKDDVSAVNDFYSGNHEPGNLNAEQQKLVFYFQDLAMFSGYPILQDEQGKTDFEKHQTTDNEILRKGLAYTFFEEAEPIENGHSGAEVRRVYATDVYYSPCNGSLFEISEPELFVKKSVPEDREYRHLPPEMEFQLLGILRNAGLSIPKIRYYEGDIYTGFIDGRSLTEYIEDSQDQESLTKVLKDAISEGRKIHRALKIGVDGGFSQREISAKTSSLIRHIYESEWEKIYAEAKKISPDLELEGIFAGLDNYFEKQIRVGEKQILADLSPNNIIITPQGKLGIFDKAYPAYDFQEIDYAVLLYYSEAMDKDTRSELKDFIVDNPQKDQSNGTRRDRKALLEYSCFKKNIFGYFFLREKAPDKAESRMNFALENYESLIDLLEDDFGLESLREPLERLEKRFIPVPA